MWHSTSWIYRMVTVTVVLLGTSLSLQAQSLVIPSASPIAARSSASAAIGEAGPAVGPVANSIGISRSAVASSAESAVLQSNPTRRDVAWMVLGGAALIVGSVVGGDGGTIIMVTGGVIGLVGLWRYLQYS